LALIVPNILVKFMDYQYISICYKDLSQWSRYSLRRQTFTPDTGLIKAGRARAKPATAQHHRLSHRCACAAGDVVYPCLLRTIMGLNGIAEIHSANIARAVMALHAQAMN
jgi:hypothetical protein